MQWDFFKYEFAIIHLTSGRRNSQCSVINSVIKYMQFTVISHHFMFCRHTNYCSRFTLSQFYNETILTRLGLTSSLALRCVNQHCNNSYNKR